MSNFNDAEVDRLKELGGNRAANATWRATWDRKQFPKPKQSEEARVKEFIRRTYVEKRWRRSEGSSRRAHEEEGDVPVEPISKIIKDPAPIHVQRSAPSHISTSNSGSFVRPRRVSNATVPPQQENNLLFSDAPVANGKSTTTAAAAPAKATTSGMDLFFGGDDFTPDWNNQSTTGAQKPPRKASGFSLADELFSNVPPAQPPKQHQQWGSVVQPQQQPWGQPQGFGPGPHQQQWSQMQNFGGFVPQPHMQPQWGVPYPQQQQPPPPQWPGSYQQQQQHQQWGQPQSHAKLDDPFGSDIQQPQQQPPPHKPQDDLFGDLSAFKSSSGGPQRSMQNINPPQQQQQQQPPPQRFNDDPFGSDAGFGSAAPMKQQPSDNPFDF